MSQRIVGFSQRTAGVIPSSGTRQPTTAAQQQATGVASPQATLPGRRQAEARDWRRMTRRAWQLASPAASPVRITARGALVGMFGIYLATALMASALNFDVLIGLGFCAACVLAPAYATRQALLEVVTVPPVIFLLAVVIVQALTAQGDSTHAWVLSVLEGTLLTLAAVAPWLFAGTMLCVVIAIRRGLPQCLRDLHAGTRGETGARTTRN